MHATPADNLSELEKLEPLLQRSLRAGGRSFRFPAGLGRIYRLVVFPSRRPGHAGRPTPPAGFAEVPAKPFDPHLREASLCGAPLCRSAAA